MLAPDGLTSGSALVRSGSDSFPGGGVAILKRMLVGRPLATVEQEHQRIPKTIALAVF
jgi:hypothetical protein